MMESEIVKAFRRHVAAGALTDAEIAFRITGGAPPERREDSAVLTGTGSLSWHASDRLHGTDRQGGDSLDSGQMRDLFEQVSASFETLLPSSEARFPPDSLVGSLTIRLPEGSATRFFAVDEQSAWPYPGSVGPEMQAVLEYFATVLATEEESGGAR